MKQFLFSISYLLLILSPTCYLMGQGGFHTAESSFSSHQGKIMNTNRSQSFTPKDHFEAEVTLADINDFLDDLVDFLEELVSEPDRFAKGSHTLQIGYGLRSNLGEDYKDKELSTVVIPQVALSYEVSPVQNIGLGIKLGAEIWEVEALRYEYAYYTGGLFVAFHPNVHERFDPYVGLGGVFRMAQLKTIDTNESNDEIGLNTFVGLKFYPTDRVGVYGEVGSFVTSFYTFGLTFLLNEG